MAPDRRTTLARPDLAAASLRGHVVADRFAEPELFEIAEAVVPMRVRPDYAAPRDTEALYGERVAVLDTRDGWAFAQLETDGYVGYVSAVSLRQAGPAATHRVAALRTFLFEQADFKGPVRLALSYGGRLAVTGFEGPYAVVEDGFVWAGHLESLDSPASDVVAEAGRFLGAPYLWGGRSSLGLDCSGLMQISHDAAGERLPRDSDMQAACGTPVETDEALSGLARGDMVFWKGHVGVMEDAAMLLHATAFSMSVMREPLRTARDRIRAGGHGEITGARRL